MKSGNKKQYPNPRDMLIPKLSLIVARFDQDTPLLVYQKIES